MRIDPNTVALVTGSSRGIGAAVARHLHARGALVVVHGRQGAPALAAELECAAVAADLAHPEGPRQLFEQARAAHGRIDIVVHNAGFGAYAPLAEAEPGRIDEMIAVNLRAVVQLARYTVVAQAESRRGHQAFMASVAGLLGVSRESVYSATKAGVIGFAEALRLEMSDSGVGVSVICPGAVDTDFFNSRGAAYDRGFPRPVSADRIATATVRAIESDRSRVVVPRWLAIAPVVQGITPRLYEHLARRFG